jgi:hypothetical protein
VSEIVCPDPDCGHLIDVAGLELPLGWFVVGCASEETHGADGVPFLFAVFVEEP